MHKHSLLTELLPSLLFSGSSLLGWLGWLLWTRRSKTYIPLRASKRDFRSKRWAGRVFSHPRWKDCTLSGLDLRDTFFQGGDLVDCDLVGVDLSGSKSSLLNFQGSSLEGAKLVGTSLLSANLRGVNLRNADLRESWLTFSDLEGADLAGADLRGCNVDASVLGTALNVHLARGIAKRSWYEAGDPPRGYRELYTRLVPDWKEAESLFEERGCDMVLAKSIFDDQWETADLVDILDAVTRLSKLSSTPLS